MIDKSSSKFKPFAPRPRFLIEPVENGFVVHNTTTRSDPYVFETIGALNNFLLREYSDE